MPDAVARACAVACKTLLLLVCLSNFALACPVAPAPANRAERRANDALLRQDRAAGEYELHLRRQRLETRQKRLEVRRERMRVKRARAHNRRIEGHAGDDYMAFRLKYLSHKMRRRTGEFVTPAPSHHQLTGDLCQLARRQSEIDHLTGSYSRGFGKSVIGTEDFTLFLVCGSPDRHGVPTVLRPENVVIVGASSVEKEYQTRLRNITAELDTNEALLADFPGIRPAKDKKGGWVSYTDHRVVLSSGSVISCMPWRGNIRGQSYMGLRPTFILIDDPETPDMVRSPDLLKRGRAWFEGDVMGAESGEAMTIVWLGTFLSYDCLLRWVQQPELGEEGGKGWTSPSGAPHFVPLLDADGNSNWPAYFPLDRVAKLKKKHGERGFAIERMLQVRPDGDQVFFRRWFVDHKYSKAAALNRDEQGRWHIYDGPPLEVFQRVDPASGKYKDKGDRFVVATVGIDPKTEDLYLLGLFRGRVPLKVQVETCIGEYDHWQPSMQTIEVNAMQVWLAQGVLDKRALRIRELNSTKNKHERIEAWSMLVANGKVHVDLDDEAQAHLVQEAEEYPLAAQNDMLDAFSGACEDALAFYRRGGQGSTKSSGHGPAKPPPPRAKDATRNLALAVALAILGRSAAIRRQECRRYRGSFGRGF